MDKEKIRRMGKKFFEQAQELKSSSKLIKYRYKRTKKTVSKASRKDFQDKSEREEIINTISSLENRELDIIVGLENGIIKDLGKLNHLLIKKK